MFKGLLSITNNKEGFLREIYLHRDIGCACFDRLRA